MAGGTPKNEARVPIDSDPAQTGREDWQLLCLIVFHLLDFKREAKNAQDNSGLEKAPHC